VLPYSVPRHLGMSVATVALVLAFTQTSLAATDPSSSPFPGLELVNSKSLDKLYRRPDVDLSEYTKIRIGEPAVEFSKNWNSRNYGTYGLSAAQLKKIRGDLADLAKSTFAKVLGDGGYQIVTESGDGVLDVVPNIINLYVNAPDTMTAGRSKTYAMDAGSMTLALQLSDSVTGTLLAMAYDSKRDPNRGKMQWSTSVSNRAAASRVLTQWAEQLKRDLDAARAK
jgi:hypothetical protein